MSLVQEKIVGINIGTEKISAVKIGKGIITSAGWANVPDGVIKQSRIESKELLTNTIKELKKKASIRNGKCALCLSSQDTIIRHIYLPEMNPDQVYQNVISDITAYLPVNPERFNIDYRIQEVIAKETVQYKVMVVATPRESVAGYVECLKAAGLDVKYVDTIENGYEKLLRYLHSKSNTAVENFAIIDFGATKTNVIVYKNGGFFVNGIFSTGANTIVNALREKLSLDKRAVEKILYSHEIQNQGSSIDTNMEQVTQFLDSVGLDIVRVLDFYQSRNSQNPIGAVYLGGSLSKIAGICEYLSSQLKLPVNSLYKMTDFMYKNTSFQTDSVDYCGAIGVTFRDVTNK
jgi:type IV pilus assembly protein PilM